MTDCGDVHFFLGLRVSRDRGRRKIYLGQSHFAKEVIARFGMKDCKPVSTPLDPSVKLTRSHEGGMYAGSTDLTEENTGRSIGLADVDTLCVKEKENALMVVRTEVLDSIR